MADPQAVTAAFTRAFGAAHVAAGDDAALAHYRRRYQHLLTDRALVALARPADVDGLRAALDLAREHGVTLWALPGPSGSAGVVGPGTKDVVLLDLGRMNRIVDIDAINATALVEPGVTYRQLAGHLREQGLPFTVDCGRNALESVAGGIASRAHGFTPYGDHALMQCGTEVLLADGLLVRTGMGAMPQSNMWQLFKWGFGPVVDGLFMQSSLGLVTKIGLWLMPEAPRTLPFRVTLADDDAMAAAVEAMQPLKVNMIVPNTVAVSSGEFEASHVLPRTSAADTQALSAAGLGRWNLVGALYGLPENVSILWEMVEGTLSAVPGATVQAEGRADDPVWAARASLMRGEPPEPVKRDLGWGGRERLGVAAAGPIAGDAARQMADIARGVLEGAGLPPLIELSLGWRMTLARVEIPYADDDASIARARKAALALVDGWAAAGYAPTHADAGELPEALTRLAPAYRQVYESLRQALDPEGLLAG